MLGEKGSSNIKCLFLKFNQLTSVKNETVYQNGQSSFLQNPFNTFGSMSQGVVPYEYIII